MDIVPRTANYIKKELQGEGTGHDWWHVERVWKSAKTIARSENANLLVVELGALLHDIADHKFHNGDDTIGPKMARQWLEQNGQPRDIIEAVEHIVEHVSFKGAGVENPMQSLEGKIVQDADRLDAMGAIGIARTFAYGGSKNREIYNPNIKPELHQTFDAYKKSTAPTINHFYEKLLLLKDGMYTQTGKKMAEERHRFMEEYLQRFYGEWEGEW
ncbi:MAG: HD domain-containing protein [Bacteroidota bacterium]